MTATNSHNDNVVAELVFKARMAESADRYEDMLEFLLQLIDINPHLSYEQRSALVIAFKNCLRSKRSAIVFLRSVAGKALEKRQEMVTEMIGKISSEIENICDQVNQVIDSKLLPYTSDHSSEVFYLKMKGDFCRYKAESQIGESRDTCISQSSGFYQNALEISSKFLSLADPLHLGLILNFSVLKYEILGKEKEAVDFASKYFSDALPHIDTLTETSYKDSTLVLQLIRDNISLWIAHREDQCDDEDNVEESVPENMKKEIPQAGNKNEPTAILKLLQENLASWNSE